MSGKYGHSNAKMVGFPGDASAAKTEDEYSQMHTAWASSVARSTGVKLEHVVPISYKEWAENQEEEDA